MYMYIPAIICSLIAHFPWIGARLFYRCHLRFVIILLDDLLWCQICRHLVVMPRSLQVMSAISDDIWHHKNSQFPVLTCECHAKPIQRAYIQIKRMILQHVTNWDKHLKDLLMVHAVKLSSYQGIFFHRDNFRLRMNNHMGRDLWGAITNPYLNSKGDFYPTHHWHYSADE